ncbi:MAG TPA: WYL domain-containing protein [Actinomycetota bacterium]|nr:WYL domain-containing protein [Actinomycetota bacterium]
MSQPKAFQRLLDIALALTAAGRVGLTTTTLMARVGYREDDVSKRAMMRDLDDLRAAGLIIDNEADPGEDARYVLRPGDLRMRVEFTAEQRTALLAALAAASAHGTVAVERRPLPVDLDRVREAVRARCVMYFDYNGKARQVDPLSWQWSGHDLVVTGWERSTQMLKSFAVVRMTGLELGPPDSANLPADVRRPGLDPITWEVDPPLRAVLNCPGFTDDTLALVGGEVAGDEVHVTVTNRLIFLARVVELGSRVRLTAPQELRDELRALLVAAQ